MRLIEKYNIYGIVATNVRSVLPHLSVAAGGTTMNVLNPSCQASGSSAEAANPNPVSIRTTTMKPGTHSSNSPSKLHEDENSSILIVHCVKYPLKNVWSDISQNCDTSSTCPSLCVCLCAHGGMCGVCVCAPTTSIPIQHLSYESSN